MGLKEQSAERGEQNLVLNEAGNEVLLGHVQLC